MYPFCSKIDGVIEGIVKNLLILNTGGVSNSLGDIS